jgi:hypothetical protein
VANRLAAFLAIQAYIDEVRGRAETGDESAVNRLVDVLVEYGDDAEATGLLRARANTGDWLVPCRLVL